MRLCHSFAAAAAATSLCFLTACGGGSGGGSSDPGSDPGTPADAIRMEVPNVSKGNDAFGDLLVSLDTPAQGAPGAEVLIRFQQEDDSGDFQTIGEATAALPSGATTVPDLFVPNIDGAYVIQVIVDADGSGQAGDSFRDWHGYNDSAELTYVADEARRQGLLGTIDKTVPITIAVDQDLANISDTATATNSICVDGRASGTSYCRLEALSADAAQPEHEFLIGLPAALDTGTAVAVEWRVGADIDDPLNRFTTAFAAFRASSQPAADAHRMTLRLYNISEDLQYRFRVMVDADGSGVAGDSPQDWSGWYGGILGNFTPDVEDAKLIGTLSSGSAFFPIDVDPTLQADAGSNG